MRKVPGKTGEEEEKFSRYTPTVDLEEEGSGEGQAIEPVILPLTGLPKGGQQAHDLSLREDGRD